MPDTFHTHAITLSYFSYLTKSFSIMILYLHIQVLVTLIKCSVSLALSLQVLTDYFFTNVDKLFNHPDHPQHVPRLWHSV